MKRVISLHDASKTSKTVRTEKLFVTKLTSDSFPREQFNVCSSRELKSVVYTLKRSYSYLNCVPYISMILTKCLVIVGTLWSGPKQKKTNHV